MNDNRTSPIIPVAWEHIRDDTVCTPHNLIRLRLERSPGLEGVTYAIRQGDFCLNKKGQWEYEPIPSSRADAFFRRCRWKHFEDALAIFEMLDPRGRIS